jgi:ABC-type transporter Mla subunit MlaD
VASVKDAQQLVQHVESALSELKDALRSNNGNLDFERVARLADEIAERADAVAETFSSLNEVLMGRIDDITGSGSGSSSSNRSSSGSRKKRAKAAS